MDVNGSKTGGCRLGSVYFVYDLVVGFCEHSSGRLFLRRRNGELFNQLSDYKIIKKDSITWNYLLS